METKQKGSLTITDEGNRLRVDLTFDPPNPPTGHPVAENLMAAYRLILNIADMEEGPVTAPETK